MNKVKVVIIMMGVLFLSLGPEARAYPAANYCPRCCPDGPGCPYGPLVPMDASGSASMSATQQLADMVGTLSIVASESVAQSTVALDVSNEPEQLIQVQCHGPAGDFSMMVSIDQVGFGNARFKLMKNGPIQPIQLDDDIRVWSDLGRHYGATVDGSGIVDIWANDAHVTRVMGGESKGIDISLRPKGSGAYDAELTLQGYGSSWTQPVKLPDVVCALSGAK